MESAKIIIYETESGQLIIVHPTPEMFDPTSKTRLSLESNGIKFESLEDVWNFIISKLYIPPNSSPLFIIDQTEIPNNREFRNAWKLDSTNKKIEQDISKIKEIWKNKLRNKRKEALVKLDVEYQKADEIGDIDKKKVIAIKKQELRDITIDPRFLSANSIEEIKQINHELLLEVED